MLRAVSVALVLVLVGCGKHPEEGAVLQALDGVASALEARDTTRLWSELDPESQTRMLDAIGQFETAQSLVDSIWDERDRPLARQALGQYLVAAAGPRDAGRGPRVVAALVDLGKLRFERETKDGLASRSVTFEDGPPERAIVRTSAGEKFGFVKANGAWKSTLLRDLVLDEQPFKELLENTKKAMAVAESKGVAWRTSRDPRTPQGTYNLARALLAKAPLDGEALFALLDDAARSAVLEALELSRKAQKKLQQKFAKPQRPKAYEAQGLGTFIEATSDTELFAKWVASPTFVKPFTASDDPETLEGDISKGTCSVVTHGGAKVALRRDEAGFWRLAGFETTIREALAAPSQKVLDTP